MRNQSSRTSDFFFIQIGSNDGKTGDPIYDYIIRYRWKGILIEPVKYLFQKLKKTYKGMKDLEFENVAIDKKTGYRWFYRVKRNNNPANPIWYDQLGSFNPIVVKKHRSLIPDFDKYFIREKIPCLSFADLLAKHKVKKVNILHIDTEGYDYEIIKLIPWGSIRVEAILYEQKHLSLHDAQACKRLLERNGYSFWQTEADVFAYKLSTWRMKYTNLLRYLWFQEDKEKKIV